MATGSRAATVSDRESSHIAADVTVEGRKTGSVITPKCALLGALLPNDPIWAIQGINTQMGELYKCIS